MTYDSVEEAIYNNLTTDTAFIANVPLVYWMAAEDGESTAYPYLVFWLVDDAGIEQRLNKKYQGEARIQFDLWDDNKIRGARLHTVVAEKVRDINTIDGGYNIMVTGINKQSIQRESQTDPYHFVVDGIVKWNKE